MQTLDSSLLQVRLDEGRDVVFSECFLVACLFGLDVSRYSCYDNSPFVIHEYDCQKILITFALALLRRHLSSTSTSFGLFLILPMMSDHLSQDPTKHDTRTVATDGSWVYTRLSSSSNYRKVLARIECFGTRELFGKKTICCCA
jgi:hypothetical protein